MDMIYPASLTKALKRGEGQERIGRGGYLTGLLKYHGESGTQGKWTDLLWLGTEDP